MTERLDARPDAAKDASAASDPRGAPRPPPLAIAAPEPAPTDTSPAGGARSPVERAAAAAGWLALLALAVAPALSESRYLVYIGTLLALQAALAVSLNLIIGYAGQFALSHAAFYGIGAYASTLLVQRAGLGFWGSLPLTALLAAVLALVIGYPSLRYTGGIHFALITFAFGELLRLVAANWHDLTGGPQGLRVNHAPGPVLGVDLSSNQGLYVVAAVTLALSLAAVALIVRSRLGRALVAIREDEVLASSMGIDVTFHKVIAFVLSSILAALAGAVYAPFMGFISPELLSASESVMMVGMLIVGGIGTLAGPILGTLFFMAVPEALRVAKLYRLVILGVVIILCVLYARAGIAGVVRRLVRALERRAER